MLVVVDAPLTPFPSCWLMQKHEQNVLAECNNSQKPFSFLSLRFRPENVYFAGGSRLGICSHGLGSFVFMALHDSLAFWHILNSVRGTSAVSIRVV